jgi:hypothetical protein
MVVLVRRFSIRNIYVFRFVEGDDLLSRLTEAVSRYGIGAGAVQLIGSLKRIKVGFFNREKGEYDYLTDEGFFELVSGIGNISWRDDNPVVHVHISVSSIDGRVYSGHLLEGNIVDATVEAVVLEFDGRLERKYDSSVGLFLLEV